MGVYVYAHDAEDFSTTGLVGDLQPLECCFEEQRNGISRLTMKLAYDEREKWKAVVNGNKIKAPVPVRVPPVITPQYSLANSVTRWKLRAASVTDSREMIPVYTREGQIFTQIRRPVAYDPASEARLMSQIDDTEVVINGMTMIRIFLSDRKYFRQGRGEYGNTSGYIEKSVLFDSYEETIPATLSGLETVESPTRIAYQLFTIESVEQTLDSVSVSCVHVFYELINNFTQWKPNAETEYNGVTACKQVLFNLASPDSRFSIESDCTDTLYGRRIDVYNKNAVEALLDPEKGIGALYGLNLIRNNYDIYMMTEVGSDRGFIVEYGKNMLGVQWKESIENVVTRVFPYGHDSEGNLIWITSTPKYVDSEHISDYAVPISEMYDTGLKIGEGGVTASNIQAKLVQEAQKRFTVDHVDLPEVSMTIQFISLGDTEEYSQYRGLDKVYLHDIISIKDSVRGYQYSAQVIGIRHDVLTGMLESVTIGNVTNWSGTRKIARWQVPEISGENIRLKSILAGAFADGSVTADAIANGAVATVHLASATIDDLTADAFQAAYANIHELIAGRITADDISANAIEAQHIGAGVIEAQHIGAGAVTTEKLYAGAVTAGKIAAGAVEADHIGAGAVIAAKIAAGAVTADKIDAGAVTAVKISTDDLTAIQAKLQIAEIANAQIASADIDYLQVKDLDAQSAYFGQTVIQEGVANKLFIPRLSVAYAQMLSATIGDLVIQATNDNFYKIDVDLAGNVTATQITPSAQEIEDGHTSDGRTIYLGTDIVADDLNTQNIYASHALMDEITANIINVDKLFAREATITKINAMDLSSNTYIRSTVGNWDSQSTITQTISSLDSRISSLGYGTVYMQPEEPDHSNLSAGDVWICTLSGTSWSDIYDDYATWEYIYDHVSTWQTLGSVPIMYVWDGRNFQLMYDALLPTTVESEIQQLQDEILLRVTQTDFDELSGEVSTFDARLDIQAAQISAAVSAVNEKAACFVRYTDPRIEYGEGVTLGDIWIKHDPYFETWETVYDYYASWQALYNAHDSWADGIGDKTYIWDGTKWVETSDRASEINSETRIDQNAHSITLLAQADATIRDELVAMDARITITAEQIRQDVSYLSSSKMDKTSQYQTADSIVSAAQSYVNGQLTSYSTTTQTSSMISAYVTDHAYTIKSGIEIKAAGIEVSGGKYVKIKSGGLFTVDSGNFSIDSSGNVAITGRITTTGGSIAGWTINASSITGNKTGIAKTTSDSDIAFWAGNASAGSAPFRVTQAGALTSTSGSIAGWTISSTSLKGNKTGLAKTTNDSDIAIWAGNATASSAAFRVTQGGAVTMTSADVSGVIRASQLYINNTLTNFAVDANGKLTTSAFAPAVQDSLFNASYVTIEGGKVAISCLATTAQNAISKAAGITVDSNTGQILLSAAQFDSLGSGSSGVYITPNQVKITSSGTFLVDSTNFKVKNNGDVEIIGTLKSGSAVDDADITGGSINIGSGTFTVDSYGHLTATSATISGTIQSGSTITGASIEGGTLNIGNGDFYVDSYGNVTLKSLTVLNESGTPTTVDLSSSSNQYPMWKLSYQTIKQNTISTDSGGYCTSFTLSNGTTVNFRSAASARAGGWSAAYDKVSWPGIGTGDSITFQAPAGDESSHPNYSQQTYTLRKNGQYIELQSGALTFARFYAYSKDPTWTHSMVTARLMNVTCTVDGYTYTTQISV